MKHLFFPIGIAFWFKILATVRISHKLTFPTLFGTCILMLHSLPYDCNWIPRTPLCRCVFLSPRAVSKNVINIWCILIRFVAISVKLQSITTVAINNIFSCVSLVQQIRQWMWTVSYAVIFWVQLMKYTLPNVDTLSTKLACYNG